jgi:hypothetical protein
VAGDDPDMVRKMRIGQLHAAVHRPRNPSPHDAHDVRLL